MKDLVKLAFVLQLIVVTSQIAAEENESELSSSLPNIWDDELVSRMVREVLAQDLFKEHEQKQLKRQHKRDVQSTIAPIGSTRASTTRKASTASQKVKKPTKVTSAGNKTKNRVTTATMSTKATVKPSTKPIGTNLAASLNIASNSSKVKVRTKNHSPERVTPRFHQFSSSTWEHCDVVIS